MFSSRRNIRISLISRRMNLRISFLIGLGCCLIGFSPDHAAASLIINNGDFSSPITANTGSVGSATPALWNNWTRPNAFQWDINTGSGVLYQIDNSGADSTIQVISGTSTAFGDGTLSFAYQVQDVNAPDDLAFRVQVIGVESNGGTWNFNNWDQGLGSPAGGASTTELFNQVFTGDTSGPASFSTNTLDFRSATYDFVAVRIGIPSGTTNTLAPGDSIEISNFALSVAVPEPSSVVFLLGLFGGLPFLRRRRSLS